MVMKYKGKTLTAEQEAHVLKVLDGNDYAVQAPPGSGKTFLLLAMARKLSGYGLSLSFNKLLAIEASKKFNSSVLCKTGHALAYGSVGYKYKKRLRKLTGKQLADTFDIGDWQLYNSPANKGYLILNTIRKYCYSADRKFSSYHLPKLTIMNDINIEEMKEDLVEHSAKVFKEMKNLSSDMPITHDVYLKIWALTNPVINKDYIFFDEYQDSNPVIADVIKKQSCQKIFVGDQFQQIYAWRGAVNALQDQQLNKLYITRSFRFGEAIADMSNQIIKSYYPYGFEYKDFHGNDDVESSIYYDPLNSVDCILCRTNKGVIAETIKALDNRLSVHILGGTQQLTYLINSIVQLKIKGYSNHPDLFLFTSFTDLKEYAESPMGGDLKPILKLLDIYGRDRLLNILESTTETPEEADITITTAHKSKGLEWSSVKLANDFKVPTDNFLPSNEETNILYVAASRALNKLDLSECQAAWKQYFNEAKRINYEQWQINQELDDNINQKFDDVIKNNIKNLEKDYP
jgi:superfamily I DNA/RNA helicase